MPRAKEYDELDLLDRAMEAFWSKGYDRTSMRDLVGKTGVNRASIYGAYRDKRALFIAAIRRYLDLIVAENVRRLYEVEDAGLAVINFFKRIADAPAARLRRGCLLTNSATEFGMADEEVARLVRSAFRRMEEVLYERLKEAQAQRQLAPGIEPRAKARLLIAVLQGLRVMARAGVGKDVMNEIISGALAGIGSEGRTVRTKQSRTRPRIH